ncbi:hypothetical protein LCGC14_1122520 [marine sediment metagenome]|uniref:Uncharacterized protein n=1 Tax=marine sediment metagenome TaxID=412755 RepID=A0A0F9Q9C5_9ZZZZ
MTNKEIETQVALGTIPRSKIFMFGFKQLVHARIRITADDQEQADKIIAGMLANGEVDRHLIDYSNETRFELDEDPKMDDEEMSRDLTIDEIRQIEEYNPDDVYVDTSWGIEDAIE